MHRRLLSPLVLSLFFCMNGCASSHKHAEVPDFTEKGWSEPNPAYAQAKAEPSIQSPGAPVANEAPAPDSSATAAATTSSAADGAPPPGDNAAPAKAKKAARKKKKKKATT